METNEPGRGRSRRRLAGALALVVAVAVVAGVVLATTSSPSSGKGNDPAKVSGAASVQRRNLIETDTESGTLSYSGPQTVYDRLTGTVTWLPQVGQLIKPGQPLFDVDGRPALLMDGSTPAWRELQSSDSDGVDILQLNQNLADLGFDADGIVVDDEWQAATTVGVEELQASLDETETGKLSLGQIVFLPGDQRITTVDGTLGDGASYDNVDPSPTQFVSLDTTHGVSAAWDATPAAGTTGTTGTTGTSGTTPYDTTPAGTTTTPTSTNTTPGGTATGTTTTPAGTTTGSKKKKSGTTSISTQTLQALIALLRAETAQLRASHSGTPGGSSGSPSSSNSGHNGSSGNNGSSGTNGNSGSKAPSSSSGANGGGAVAGTAILLTSSTQLVVTVDLDASVQSEAVVGEPVTVEMPAGNTVNGTVTAVSPVAQSSSNNGNGNGGGGGGSGGGGGGGGNNGSSSTIPVTITLKGRISGAGLDQAAVSVNFSQAKANNVLSVPVTALLATAGGGYAVQAAVAPHKLIPVQTGLFAAGYVQISGAGIYPGLQVTDSQG